MALVTYGLHSKGLMPWKSKESSKIARLNRIKKRFELGLCKLCGGNIERPPRLYCDSCLKRTCDRLRKKRISSRESKTCYRCGSKELYKTSTCYACHHKVYLNHLKIRKSIKDKVFNHYGKSCKCCGEDNFDFLTIDHINNDGAEQRRGGARGTLHYKEIIKRGFPNDLQTLCFNCNCGKQRNGGICPHISLRTYERSRVK